MNTAHHLEVEDDINQERQSGLENQEPIIKREDFIDALLENNDLLHLYTKFIYKIEPKILSLVIIYLKRLT